MKADFDSIKVGDKVRRYDSPDFPVLRVKKIMKLCKTVTLIDDRNGEEDYLIAKDFNGSQYYFFQLPMDL